MCDEHKRLTVAAMTSERCAATEGHTFQALLQSASSTASASAYPICMQTGMQSSHDTA
jgi:hypothetical protein